MRGFGKKSFYVMITTYLSIWFVISLVAGGILDSYKNTINEALKLEGYRTETIKEENEDTEYFKSSYVKKDEDGKPLTVTESNGYTHEVYDDEALNKKNIEKARQVQREGTTILWNSKTNGLPLNKDDKVSLFSHSSVDFAYSGAGSGYAYVKGAADLKNGLTSAGLQVNTKLWDFYSKGAGSGEEYTRELKNKVNEVPWSKYGDAEKTSFATYNDAAIITISRKLGEGSVANGGAYDANHQSADTLSGDYFDFSAQEIKMIQEVINYKKNNVFKKVIVLLNTPTGLWLEPLMQFKDDIDSCVWVGQGGFEACNEIGNILAGNSIPSGHLVDTFVYNTRSCPAYVNAFSSIYENVDKYNFKNIEYQGGYIIYAENIYVGYKYYETRYEDAVLNRYNATSSKGVVSGSGNWKYSDEVAFPFGYGESYTEFEYNNYQVNKNSDGNYEVTLEVKNVGNNKGADAVQIYVQKPYTDYDIEYNLEQSAVNLAGYAKTRELDPNESEVVKIIVDDDAFKTYDDENKKTFIREKGTYYIAAGHNAHNALNNILNEKGYTPSNTNNVMDEVGDKSLVKAFSFDKDDFNTFSVSDSTNKEITNQFEQADWNKYANKSNGEVTYLSRSDWDKTYPTEVLKLSLNDKFAADLAYNKKVAANPNDKMPLYNQPHQFNLIDMRKLDYDNQAWDTLLNQLTLDEQIQLLANSYHGTPAILSIAKHKELTNDGPMGIRYKYENSSLRTMSFPSNVLLAASYNDVLAREIGELLGEDMLHSGLSGIYAPSANLHRTTYGGRSYEYYSEDGFISGIMAKEQVIGIQSKGCYVNMKHLALNDQESGRYGVATWANEQSIRETYLPAFEPAVEEGNATGIMSAFNRLGAIWSGAHSGLCNVVLREEWGFEGFVISDCAWRFYMGPVDGLMGGTDCILDENIDETPYQDAKNNPTIALKIREATHRVLYVIVNSNAMNGISSNTRIYEVKVWWQHLVTGVQIGFGVLLGISIVALVLSIIYNKQINEYLRAKRIKKLTKKNENASNPEYVRKHKIKIIAISIPIVGIVAATIGTLTPLLINNCPSSSSSSSSSENISSNQPNVDEAKEYRFEAECAEIVTNIPTLGAGIEPNKTVASTNYPSGDAYVWKLQGAGEASLTFHVYSSEDTTATLTFCIGLSNEKTAAQLFNVTINDSPITYYDPVTVFPKYDAVGDLRYFNWTNLPVADVTLKEGHNTVVLTKNTDGLNLDYISFITTATLQEGRDVINGGHYYHDLEVVTEPSYECTGEVVGRCKNCRHSNTIQLPKISVENGYTKTDIIENGVDKFGEAKYEYTINDQTFTFNLKTYPTNSSGYKFEAERGILTGDAVSGRDVDSHNPSGGSYVEKMSSNIAGITIKITSNKDVEALFIINLGCRNDMDLKCNKGRTLTVNDELVNISDDVIFKKANSTYNWFNWREYDVAMISLKSGVNIISFDNIDDSSKFSNVDYFKIISTSTLDWYFEV